jgi:hypothetical protein
MARGGSCWNSNVGQMSMQINTPDAGAKMPKGRNWVMRDPRMSSGVPITKDSFDWVIVLPACTGYSA